MEAQYDITSPERVITLPVPLTERQITLVASVNGREAYPVSLQIYLSGSKSRANAEKLRGMHLEWVAETERAGFLREFQARALAEGVTVTKVGLPWERTLAIAPADRENTLGPGAAEHVMRGLEMALRETLHTPAGQRLAGKLREYDSKPARVHPRKGQTRVEALQRERAMAEVQADAILAIVDAHRENREGLWAALVEYCRAAPRSRPLP